MTNFISIFKKALKLHSDGKAKDIGSGVSHILGERS
jgi:hypothetical protein